MSCLLRKRRGSFLNAFHEEEKIEEAQQRRLPDTTAYIPEENRALEGLGE